MSLRDLVLNASDLPVETVNVPEWGAAVYLKPLNGLVREQWGESWDKYKQDNNLPDSIDDSHYHAVALVHALSDEHGSLLFGMADVPSLRGKSPHVLKRLYGLFKDQNKLNVDAVENERKNS